MTLLRERSLALTLLASLALAAPALAQAPDTDDHGVHDAHHGDDDPDHAPERIVVTGTPIEHDRDELAVPVDRVDREELLDNLGATLGETLARKPGIATSGFSGGASRPVIRGQDAFRTEILEDGLPTQDVSRESQDHAIPVNPLAYERVEIVRGPATLRYGGGASAGVVNMVSNSVPDRLPDEPAMGALYGAIDTVAERRDVALALDGALGDTAWHIDGVLRDTKDYEIPTGGRQNGTFADSYSATVGVSHFLGELGRVGLAYTRAENEYGIPEDDEDARVDMATNRVRFETDWYDALPGIHEIRVRGLWSDYEHDEIVEGVVGQTFRNAQFDGRLELLHEPVAGFVGAFGLSGRHREFEALGEAVAYLAPTEAVSVAGYVFEERELVPDLVAELGMRIEGTTVEGTPAGAVGPRKRSFLPLSGSVGLVATPWDDVSIGLLGAASQRAPAEVELFARGPHEATETFERGNADLDEETSYTGELRVTARFDRVRAEAAGFVTYYDGYIFGELTGLFFDEGGAGVLPGDPDALDELVYGARDALFAGAEVKAEVDLLYALEGIFGLEAQFDYVQARFRSGADRHVPRITPIRWGGALFFDHDRVRARVGFLRTEGQRDVATFEVPTGSHTFLDASLAVRLTPIEARVPVELTVHGENLTDAKGRNHVSFNAQELLLPGRNIRVGVRVSF